MINLLHNRTRLISLNAYMVQMIDTLCTKLPVPIWLLATPLYYLLVVFFCFVVTYKNVNAHLFNDSEAVSC